MLVVVEAEAVRAVEEVLEVEVQPGVMDMEVGLVKEGVQGTVVVELRQPGMVVEEEEVAVEVEEVV